MQEDNDTPAFASRVSDEDAVYDVDFNVEDVYKKVTGITTRQVYRTRQN